MAERVTRLSTKGQVILPKAVRERRRWAAGTRLVVEETPDGVLLKVAPAFEPTLHEDVFASLPYRGPTRTQADMAAGVAREARRRHDRD